MGRVDVIKLCGAMVLIQWGVHIKSVGGICSVSDNTCRETCVGREISVGYIFFNDRSGSRCSGGYEGRWGK